jgi:hypothetical protein
VRLDGVFNVAELRTIIGFLEQIQPLEIPGLMPCLA